MGWCTAPPGIPATGCLAQSICKTEGLYSDPTPVFRLPDSIRNSPDLHFTVVHYPQVNCTAVSITWVPTRAFPWNASEYTETDVLCYKKCRLGAPAQQKSGHVKHLASRREWESHFFHPWVSDLVLQLSLERLKLKAFEGPSTSCLSTYMPTASLH